MIAPKPPHRLFAKDSRQQGIVGDIALVESDRVGDGETVAGRQVVDHRDPPARIDEREHGVAPDVSGAAGHQHCRPDHAFHGPQGLRTKP
jgi:hypothetical protein